MKNISYLCFFIFSLLLNSSCEKTDDFVLSQSVFIEDPYCPGLPVYSEWGYNTFGAYIDRKPFISTDYDLPVKIIVNTDTLHMIMRGTMGGQDVELKFSMKGFSPATHYDLTSLNNMTINLKQSGRKVTMIKNGHVNVLSLIEGEMRFDRVQLLYVDEELTRTIISGHFNLKTFLDGEPAAISYGRFDFGIGYESFYNY